MVACAAVGAALGRSMGEHGNGGPALPRGMPAQNACHRQPPSPCQPGNTQLARAHIGTHPVPSHGGKQVAQQLGVEVIEGAAVQRLLVALQQPERGGASNLPTCRIAQCTTPAAEAAAFARGWPAGRAGGRAGGSGSGLQEEAAGRSAITMKGGSQCSQLTRPSPCRPRNSPSSKMAERIT